MSYTPAQQAARWLADAMATLAAGRPVSLVELASMLVIYPGVEVRSVPQSSGQRIAIFLPVPSTERPEEER